MDDPLAVEYLSEISEEMLTSSPSGVGRPLIRDLCEFRGLSASPPRLTPCTADEAAPRATLRALAIDRGSVFLGEVGKNTTPPRCCAYGDRVDPSADSCDGRPPPVACRAIRYVSNAADRTDDTVEVDSIVETVMSSSSSISDDCATKRTGCLVKEGEKVGYGWWCCCLRAPVPVETVMSSSSSISDDCATKRTGCLVKEGEKVGYGWWCCCLRAPVPARDEWGGDTDSANPTRGDISPRLIFPTLPSIFLSVGDRGDAMCDDMKPVGPSVKRNSVNQNQDVQVFAISSFSFLGAIFRHRKQKERCHKR